MSPTRSHDIPTGQRLDLLSPRLEVRDASSDLRLRKRVKRWIRPDRIDWDSLETLQALEQLSAFDRHHDPTLERMVKYMEKERKELFRVWNSEICGLSEEGFQEARRLQRKYRKITFRLKFAPLPVNRTLRTLREAETVVVGRQCEPGVTYAGGIAWSAGSYRDWKIRLPYVHVTAAEGGDWMVTNEAWSRLSVTVKTDPDERTVYISAEYR